MFTSVALAALLAVGHPVPAAGVEQSAANRNPRVRPYDSRSAAVLLQGIDRSATMRLLIDRLETLDVIVYVETQPALRSRLAGRLVWVTSAGRFRYVRISLNPELSSEMMIAALGHELQHALEVALSPTIVDEPSLEAYYRQHGFNQRSHVSGWDTQAARDMGDLVRREIANRPARTALESIQAFDPATWHIVYRRARDRHVSR